MKSLFNYNSCAFVAGAQYIRNFPNSSYPEVAFIGRSNVGKSTIINAMLSTDKVARTSSKAGCTKQINFFLLNDKLMLVDMPGYGYANVSKSEADRINSLIFDYFETRKQLRMVFLLVDGRRGIGEMDKALMEFFRDRGLLFTIIVTKIDKVVDKEINALKDELSTIASLYGSMYDRVFYTNAKKKIGISDLKGFIAHSEFMQI